MQPMKQAKTNVKNIRDHESQFLYMSRWVEKDHFRAFVYNDKGEEKLANSYSEFLQLTGSGLWLEEKPDLQKGKRNVPLRTDSK